MYVCMYYVYIYVCVSTLRNKGLSSIFINSELAI